MSNSFKTVQSSYISLPNPTDDLHQNKIHLRSTTNPLSKPANPTIIFITGLGSSCLSLTPLQHALARSSIPSFTYDRLGTGRSSPLPSSQSTKEAAQGEDEKLPPRHATALALELDQVLRTADIIPPYVLVPHSHGGVIAWEYISSHPSNVVGLIALDANTSRSPDRPVRDQDLSILWQDLPEGALDYNEIVGLNAANRLPTELWEEASGKRSPPEPWLCGTGGEEAEMAVCEESCRALGRLGLCEKRPLGRWPVTVIKGDTEGDLRKLIDASKVLGGGAEGVHEVLRGRLEGYGEMDGEMQRDHLQLTATGSRRYVEAKKSGHWVHIIEPELVVEEILRMITEIAGMV